MAQLTSSTRPKAILIGGTGIIGSGILLNLIESHDIIVPSRSQQSLDKLTQLLKKYGKDVERMKGVVGYDLSNEQQAKQLANKVKEKMLRDGEKVEHTIAAIGPSYELDEKGILGVDQRFLVEKVNEKMLAHLNAAKYFLPLTQNSYTMISGALDTKYFAPTWSLLNVTAGVHHGLSLH